MRILGSDQNMSHMNDDQTIMQDGPRPPEQGACSLNKNLCHCPFKAAVVPRRAWEWFADADACLGSLSGYSICICMQGASKWPTL